jgi:hypothetical protein
MAKISLIQFVLWSQHHHNASLTVTEPSLHLSTTRASRLRVQVVYPLEPYLWRQHSSANPSPTQRSCRALSRWLALPVLLMALLLPKRRQLVQLLASPMAADIVMNLFVLEQMCLVSATNVLLSNSSAPAGCRRASRMQAGRPRAGRKKQLHIVCTQTTTMYEYVPSQSGPKISCESINKHALSLYRYTGIY